MIDMRLKQFFFDAKAVTSRVDSATRKVLSKFGAFVRRTAKNSIKKAPFVSRKPRGKERTDLRRKSSRPGNPPFSQTGTLKKFIFFSYDATAKGVVIGPAAVKPRPTAPETLERGGKTVGKKARQLSAADFMSWGFGPMRVEPVTTRTFLSTSSSSSYRRMSWSEKGTVVVTRVPIRTKRQAQRAARLHNRYGLGGRPGGRIEPRPYMGPPFEKGQSKLPAMWKDSVR